ncbi:hypothetical protein [Streptomyces sp. NPDC050856]|uniref:hypothetical protein n=1 Tax=Streptomyces sp. NPDC050856 TaxID=3154939 RepID=UPI0033C38CFD
MGWTVLYIAFGVVALWLLGEVLLQYKARLRWRVLAFTGFLGVVVGVLLPSVLVIIVGALAFAVGQTYVTLSFRRGFSTGWAIGGRPGASRRRRSGAKPPAGGPGPVLEVSGMEDGDTGPGRDTSSPERPADDVTAVYEPQPLPDETGQYGVYNPATAGFPAPERDGGAERHSAPYDTAGPYDGGNYDTTFGGYAPAGGDVPDAHSAPYDYGTGAPQYAAYSDPYIGTSPGPQGYGGYEGRQPYADPYAPQYGTDTPPGGLWVPQQRDSEQQVPPPPQEPPAPYGYDPGPGDQYRH